METKICTKCGEELPATLEYFYKDKTYTNGLRGSCKKCEIKRSKEYKINNTEKIKEYIKNNKERIAKNKRKWYENNKESLSIAAKKYYKENKEHICALKKEYQKQNKCECNLYMNRRKAKKKLLENNYTAENWKKTKEYFNNKCCYCGKTIKLTQDHFIPLSKGGGYVVTNIVPSCQSCNSSKGNKDFFEWYPKQEYYSENREKKVLEFLDYECNY